MPTKIRLQRKGKKGQPFYHIVIADGRAPRDGKYIERIGSYNPITKPAEINIQFDRALHWLQTGAQPTDTVRAILSYKGILYKNHLDKGVKKGALTQEQADAKFDSWLKDKEAKVEGEVKNIEIAIREDKKKRLDAEKKINEERAKELAAKKASELKLEAGDDEENAEEVAEDTAPVAEEAAPVAEEAKEEPKAEVAEEPKAEEPKAEKPKEEEPKAEEKKEEAQKTEAKKEEPKKEEKKEEEKKLNSV
ncbi:MAG: 30S ribosomal protein S16 [Chlorobi bacterium]|nr:30S ribosomal protein S16 [Chlorobiota bacterium]